MSRHILHRQNHQGKFINPQVLWKCSESNRIIGVKDDAFIQMNVAEAGKVPGGLMASLKPMLSVGPFAGWKSQMILF